MLSLSLTQEFVRPLYHWRTSRPHDYLDSPLNAGDDDSAAFTTGPSCGAPLPNVKLGDDDFLLDHLGARFTLLLPEDAEIETGTDVHALRLPHPACARLGLASKTAAILVRPDQHVCARWTHLTAVRLRAALARASARESTPC